ncbi:septum formation initiator family protein [Desulfosporosinus sp. PR]|uniref:FtsB family cell division protein n=1 Tax=Candidatus Desulfosporosinus nitrosoreducens TaxID=3401928 RepID=UPI0027F750C2|nr:septum formation initiator family protein [Desulfosporosinus sp. PR]MDQ7092799.1 septum formation initiator family protein [Desulfosporosinus sp. PR]
MKKSHQKIKSKQRLRFRPGVIFVLGLVFAGAGSSAWQLWKLHVSVEQQLAQLNQEKETLLQQQKSLHEEIAQLNTPSYIEQLAREQLGLVKHGEILISPKN